MLVHQAFRYELDPTNLQRSSLAQHAGAARYAYNWGLAERKGRLEAGEGATNSIAQHKQWNRFKREGAPWWRKVSKCALQEALRDLDEAIKGFFRSRKKKGGRKVGFPRFKRKGQKDSFRLTGSIQVGPKSATLPAWERSELRSRPPSCWHLGHGSPRRPAGGSRSLARFVGGGARAPRPRSGRRPRGGIDRGITSLAVCSDGFVIESPRALNQGLAKLRRHLEKLQVAVSLTETQNACGEGSSGQDGNALVKLPSLCRRRPKQEPDSKARERFA